MKTISLNQNWRFNELGSEKSENISVPHTVAIEPLNVSQNKQGVFEYRKSFVPDEIYPEQKVYLRFEAVMMNCRVFVNNHPAGEHYGGYLPFLLDITDLVRYKEENSILVTVDNRDDPDTPPGKPTGELDFLYYGGIYRNADLIITPAVHLTDPMDRSVDHGGVLITSVLGSGKAKISVRENVKNCSRRAKTVSVTHTVYYKGIKADSFRSELHIAAGGNLMARAEFVISAPHLWSPEHPELYTLETLLEYDSIKENRMTDFGIRSITADPTGLYLNGEKIKLFGFNRGQQYPYLGIAVSDEAQRREARLLKESGINCLRLAHYPHSPAFIDECDRIGLLLIDPVPGWQFRGNETWKNRLTENTQDLVRRDRNHPSVILYEVTPNETNWATSEGDAFLHRLHEIVKVECPGALTGGDNLGRKDSLFVGFDIPYYGKDGRSALSRFFRKDRRLTLKREYGDWAFGGNRSTSRTGRGDGEEAMQLQTWNFQFDHNNNWREGGILGDLIWEGIDHNRGYYPDDPISKSGVYDIFRIPKLSYQFVKSQQVPSSDEDHLIFLNALSWEDKSKLVFYSTCDHLALYGDGKLIAEADRDNGPDTPFDPKKDEKIKDDYWMTDEDHIEMSKKACPLAHFVKRHMFDGGNCQHMDHPPFTFTNLDLSAVSVLEARGSCKGKTVKSEQFFRHSPFTKLSVDAKTFGIPLEANDNDFVFVYVSALDEHDRTDTQFSGLVTVSVENGNVIGHYRINAEAGIAAFLIKADKGAENVTVSAEAEGICSACVIPCQK